MTVVRPPDLLATDPDHKGSVTYTFGIPVICPIVIVVNVIVVTDASLKQLVHSHAILGYLSRCIDSFPEWWPEKCDRSPFSNIRAGIVPSKGTHKESAARVMYF